jgi:hypothetical protein
LDSSIDSFWQTTQRRPRLISRARASSAGSASISFGSTATAGHQVMRTTAARSNHLGMGVEPSHRLCCTTDAVLG